jgi:hypothetical protein
MTGSNTLVSSQQRYANEDLWLSGGCLTVAGPLPLYPMTRLDRKHDLPIPYYTEIRFGP